MDRDDFTKYIKAMVSPFLSKPDEMECTFSIDDLGTLYSLKIEQSDRGRIIGRKGETINALKYIIRSAGLTHGIRVSLKLIE